MWYTTDLVCSYAMSYSISFEHYVELLNQHNHSIHSIQTTALLYLKWKHGVIELTALLFSILRGINNHCLHCHFWYNYVQLNAYETIIMLLYLVIFDMYPFAASITGVHKTLHMSGTNWTLECFGFFEYFINQLLINTIIFGTLWSKSLFC